MFSVPPLAGLQETIKFLLPQITEIVSAEETAIRPEKEGPVWVYKDGAICQAKRYKHTKNGVYVPLKSGGWLLLIGVKTNFNESVLSQYCNQVLENARRYDDIQNRAVVDALTGIPNRNALYQRLYEEIERQGKFCVIFIDINDFKRVNDSYGHIVGDDVLRKATGKIKTILRTSDFIARFGGDEFVVLLPRTDQKEGEKIAERIGQQKIPVGDMLIGLSWGLSTFPDDGNTLDQIIECADRRMYCYKSKVKGVCC